MLIYGYFISLFRRVEISIIYNTTHCAFSIINISKYVPHEGFLSFAFRLICLINTLYFILFHILQHSYRQNGTLLNSNTKLSNFSYEKVSLSAQKIAPISRKQYFNASADAIRLSADIGITTILYLAISLKSLIFAQLNYIIAPVV